MIRLYPGREKNLNVVNATQVNGLYGSRSADLTKAEIAELCSDMSVASVERHLRALCEAGEIEKCGGGRSTYYVRRE